MDIRFCGGAQTVTGSQHLISVNGKTILLECGLFQGRRHETYERNLNFPFEPSKVDVMILSHAHNDHAGNIPNLVKKGFAGSIYATPATVDLCKIMLKDSAYLHEKDVEWVNKIRAKNKLPPIEPLYTIADAEAAMDFFAPVEYEQSFTAAPGVTVTFKEAGHILGSAVVLLEIEEKGKRTELGFTGDIGRPNMPVVRDPIILRELDALIIETTYGNRMHGSSDEVNEELAQTVRDVAASGGKIIIPSFAVGRTQQVVYILHKLFDQNRIPEIPIFVDSPMAVKATEVTRKYPQYLDREAHRLFLNDDEDPFGFRRLKYVTDVKDSKDLNGLSFPHIIISASGMAEGGRVLHHLKNGVGNPKNMVLFVGYAAKETLARKLMDGQKVVKIFDEEHTVRCKIKVMDAFSAHGDRRDLLNYVKMSSPQKLRNIFLVHGEPEQAIPFRDALQSMGYRGVHYPALNDVLTI
jgi:metallo-beta-lactamase family protein